MCVCVCVCLCVCVCVCSISYPARNAHALYSQLWPVPLYNIFPHYLTKGTIFEKKKVIQRKMCVYFLHNFCPTFLFRTTIHWHTAINVRRLVNVNKVSIFLVRFYLRPKFLVMFQISWKSVWREASCSMRTDGRTDGQTDGRTDGQTDGHDEANSRVSRFFECA